MFGALKEMLSAKQNTCRWKRRGGTKEKKKMRKITHRWASNPRTLGSIPWRGRVRNIFSCNPFYNPFEEVQKLMLDLVGEGGLGWEVLIIHFRLCFSSSEMLTFSSCAIQQEAPTAFPFGLRTSNSLCRRLTGPILPQ